MSKRKRHPLVREFAELAKRMAEITRDDIDIDPEDWPVICQHVRRIQALIDSGPRRPA